MSCGTTSTGSCGTGVAQKHDHAHDHSHSHGEAQGGGCCGGSSNTAVMEVEAPVISSGPPPVIVTEKAASEVRRHISEMQHDEELAGKPLYLRLRVQGGGCSGFQNKLDLDPTFNAKIDSLFEIHGVQVVIDKRSLLYLQGATVDFHDDLNKRGFSVTNPTAKGTCGCGSSYSM
jgi:iron-sulfur cluster assembly accessory protein